MVSRISTNSIVSQQADLSGLNAVYGQASLAMDSYALVSTNSFQPAFKAPLLFAPVPTLQSPIATTNKFIITGTLILYTIDKIISKAQDATPQEYSLPAGVPDTINELDAGITPPGSFLDAGVTG